METLEFTILIFGGWFVSLFLVCLFLLWWWACFLGRIQELLRGGVRGWYCSAEWEVHDSKEGAVSPEPFQ